LSVLGIVAAQIILGALTVQLELTPALVVMHLGLATLFLAVRLVQAVGALRGAADAPPASPSLHRLVQAAAAATYLMILIGGYVAASGAGLACPDVPLCRGAALLPPGLGARMHMLHRGWSLVVLALVLWTSTAAAQAAPAGGRAITAATRLAAALVLLQFAVGLLNIVTRLTPLVRGAHLGIAALLFGTLIVLLLITTATTMLIAAPQRVGLGVLLLTLLGGTLAAGSANAFNMYIDRDIDALMRRTCLRPVPAGRLRPAQALGFGVVTGLLSVGVMAWGVNGLSAILSTAGILFYVGIYTLWLKRATPQNIVIGGAAGAVPPLVGWAAATGHLAPAAVVLFAIVFLWTPPHFWALALGKTDDYRAAGVPMLP